MLELLLFYQLLPPLCWLWLWDGFLWGLFLQVLQSLRSSHLDPGFVMIGHPELGLCGRVTWSSSFLRLDWLLPCWLAGWLCGSLAGENLEPGPEARGLERLEGWSWNTQEGLSLWGQHGAGR